MSTQQPTPQPAVTFEEIRALLRNLPGPDLESGTAALQRERQLTKPAGSLGRLEELAQWVATWQGQHPPDLRRPRVAVFAGNHGVAARGVSAYPAEVTVQMVANFQNGGAAVKSALRGGGRRSARLRAGPGKPHRRLHPRPRHG